MRNMVTPMGSAGNGSRRTVRDVQIPSGRRKIQEAKAGGRTNDPIVGGSSKAQGTGAVHTSPITCRIGPYPWRYPRRKAADVDLVNRPK
jgi:hypothetical protein